MPKGIYKHKPLTEEHKKNISKANKGRIVLDITKEKIRKKLLGHKQSKRTLKKIVETRRKNKSYGHSEKWKKEMSKLFSGKGNPFYGKHHSMESKEKISNVQKGSSCSEETKRKMSKVRMGYKVSKKTRIKLSILKKGKNNWNWKNGISPKNKRIRKGLKFKLWREAVFARDNYTCQKYGLKNGNGKTIVFHPHHIRNFAEYPKLRFKTDNGITLSEKAHKEFHKKYGTRNNTEEQLKKFISKN